MARKVSTLYPFQKDAVKALKMPNKHIIVAGCGSGKTAISLVWADWARKETKKKKLLIVTTASKSHTTDWQDEADTFAPTLKKGLKEFEVVSWHLIKKWLSTKTYDEIGDYIVIFDEIQRSKAGVSSLMGKAMLTITKHTPDWVGATGTPGDGWIDFYPYFQAGGYVKNKTEFQNGFCMMQRYPYPAILRYLHTEVLKSWWDKMTVAPDTSKIMAQLPPETHQVVKLPAPKGYKKVMKTNKTLEGELLESDMEMLHYLRQICNTPDKLSYVSDLLESLSSPLVVFYNYTCERESILELAKKLKRKVWRIDGEKHEIPTADTIGERDIVLCHYLSGSEALNLQYINYMVFYSPNYSYSVSVQAKGRIKRIGQQKPMFYWSLVCSSSVEEEIMRCLHDKRDFAESEWVPGVKR